MCLSDDPQCSITEILWFCIFGEILNKCERNRGLSMDVTWITNFLNVRLSRN